MHCLRVAGAAQKHAVHAERHATDADASFHSTAKFVNFRTIGYIENAYHRSFLTGGRNSRSVVTESQGCQWTIMSCDHGFRMLIQKIVKKLTSEDDNVTNQIENKEDGE